LLGEFVSTRPDPTTKQRPDQPGPIFAVPTKMASKLSNLMVDGTGGGLTSSKALLPTNDCDLASHAMHVTLPLEFGAWVVQTQTYRCFLTISLSSGLRLSM